MRRCHHCDIVLCCNELSSEVGRLAQQRNAAWVANGGAVGNRDAIGICQLCRLSLSVCECVLVAATELARLRRCEEMIPVYQRALQKIYDTTSDNLSAAIAEGVLSPKYVEESDSRCTPRLAEREGGGG